MYVYNWKKKTLDPDCPTRIFSELSVLAKIDKRAGDTQFLMIVKP